MQDVRTTIVIVDDDEMARRGLCALLHAQADLHVIADCATVRDAVARVVRFGPQVVVMEPALPDIDGCDPCGLVHEHAPDARIVMLLARVDPHTVVAGVQAGATAVVSKRARLAEICEAVRAAAAGTPHLDAAATAALFQHLRHRAVDTDADQTLTELERRVLARVAAGRTNRQIAQELALSETVVKSHLSRAFGKLHVTRRARAAVLFAAAARAVDGGREGHEAA